MIRWQKRNSDLRKDSAPVVCSDDMVKCKNRISATNQHRASPSHVPFECDLPSKYDFSVAKDTDIVVK